MASKKPFKTPTCPSCGRQHYNFTSCGQAAKEQAGPKQPPIEWKREGWLPFGDRLGDWEMQGGTMWKLGKARRIGNVIEPKEEDG